MPTPEQIERLAAMANVLRPDWPTRSLITHLTEHHAARPYRDLAAALAYIATDSATLTPKRLTENGPWWVIGDARRPTPEPNHPKCPDHPGELYPCAQCQPNLRPATREGIAAVREAARRGKLTARALGHTPNPTLAQLENARRGAK